MMPRQLKGESDAEFAAWQEGQDRKPRQRKYTDEDDKNAKNCAPEYGLPLEQRLRAASNLGPTSDQ